MRKISWTLFISGCAALLFFAQFPAAGEEKPLKPVKYVFLFIGDGMGAAQRGAAEEYAKKMTGKGLAINGMPYRAETTTYAANQAVTDSAASGTAIATGSKTNIWHLGVDPKGNRLESIAEHAKKAGKKVAVISSKNINDATPAAFYAHRKSRGDLYSIGLDLLESDFDYFGGGGILDHNAVKSPAFRGDIYELAQKKGYRVESDPKKIMALKPGAGKVIVGIKGGRMPYAFENKSLRLAEYLEKAVELMKDHENGFFLMCEGGKIDWACHANNAYTMLEDILDLDLAVRKAMEFASRHPDETLIVVTADHETGGLSFGKEASGYPVDYELLKQNKIARGTFALKFIRLKKEQSPYSFADLKTELHKTYGFLFPGEKNPKGDKRLLLTEPELKELEQRFEKHFVNGRGNVDSYAFDTYLLALYNRKAGFVWTTTGHTATPVLTTAAGVQAGRFSKPMDNTDIGKRLKQAVR